MMSRELVVVGLSHRTAPVSVREQVAIKNEDVPGILAHLASLADLPEAVLVSTCNRVELIAASREPHVLCDGLTQLFKERVSGAEVEPCMYRHIGVDAAEHLFRVSSGLDSMVLGEPQILGQVKDSLSRAEQQQTLGTLLRRCFDRSFKVAKRIRTETQVAAGNVSVSSIACELAEKIFGDLHGRKALLVGAGEMSEVAARSLTTRGSHLSVINRSSARAEKLAASCNGVARPLESLATELAEADVVITSTSKTDFVITHDMMQSVCKLRRWRPLFIIDIAVPRDVDPRVDQLRNVFVYDMDDLGKVSRQNLAARERALKDAEQILASELVEFERWRRAQLLTPTIVALREQVHHTLRQELNKTLPKLASIQEADRQTLERMCQTMTNQLLHAPLTELKRNSDNEEVVETVRRLFQLEDQEPPSRASITQLAPRSQGLPELASQAGVGSQVRKA